MSNRIEPKQINFRISEEEYNRISNMAIDIGLSTTKFCKLKVLGIKTRVPKMSNSDMAKITSELRRIGTNINQIAKHLNSGFNVKEEQIEGIQTNYLMSIAKLKQ